MLPADSRRSISAPPADGKADERIVTSRSGRRSAGKNRSTKGVSIQVKFLDDTVTGFRVQYKALGRWLIDQVFSMLNLVEVDYFGLEYYDANGTRFWLDPEKPIYRQLSFDLEHPILYFSVKFYTPDPCKLEDELTRYLFALQIKRDLAEGTLQCNENTAALIASYIIQSELGDFNPSDCPDGNPVYISQYFLVPSQDASFEWKVMEHHRRHAGQSSATADNNLLETARRCDFYGVKLTPVKDPEGVPLNIAVNYGGILIFQNYSKVATYPWNRIRKLCFKRKKFFLKLHPQSSVEQRSQQQQQQQPQQQQQQADNSAAIAEASSTVEHCVEYVFEARNESKNFWKKCIEQHTFFRCTEPKTIEKPNGKFFKQGSSFRYSGRTKKQLEDYVRGNIVKRQPFQRSSSFRASSLSRRTDAGSNLSIHQGLSIAPPNIDNVHGTIDRRSSKYHHSNTSESQLDISHHQMYSGSKELLAPQTTNSNSTQQQFTNTTNVEILTDVTPVTTTVDSSVTNVADASLTIDIVKSTGTLADDENDGVTLRKLLLSDNHRNFIDTLVRDIIKDAIIARTVKEYYITKLTTPGGGYVQDTMKRLKCTSDVDKMSHENENDHIQVSTCLSNNELSVHAVDSDKPSIDTQVTIDTKLRDHSHHQQQHRHHKHNRSQRSRKREIDCTSRTMKRSRSHCEYSRTGGRMTPTVFVKTDTFTDTHASPVRKSVLYVSLSNLPNSQSYSYRDDTKSDSLEELIMAKVASIEMTQGKKLQSKSLDHLTRRSSDKRRDISEQGANHDAVSVDDIDTARADGDGRGGAAGVTNALSSTTVAGEHTICSVGDLCDFVNDVDSEYDSVELLSNYSASRMHITDFNNDEFVDCNDNNVKLIDSIISSNLLAHKPDDLDIESYTVHITRDGNAVSSTCSVDNVIAYDCSRDYNLSHNLLSGDDNFHYTSDSSILSNIDFALVKLVLTVNLSESYLF